MKLSAIIREDEDNSIEYLMRKYVSDASEGASDKQLQKWLSMISVRLATLGAGQGSIKKIVASLRGATDEKDVDKIAAKYDLYNDYPETFMATEMKLSDAIHEEVNEDVKKYKLVLSIPFTTEKNRKVKIDELKFHFALKNIKIDKLTPVNVGEIGSGVLDYQVVAFINTTMSRNELEHELEPEYKINKIQRLVSTQTDTEEDAD